MARKRKGRPVNGIVLLDKPLEISSNQALQQVKRLYFAQKAGHTGALDPLATGMLPICLGEGTKFSQFLLDTDKTYIVTAKLGVRTTTSDADGDVVSEKNVDINEDQLFTAVDKFRGQSKQVPSMFSALKYQGQPLYKYAREGIEVPREARDINVYRLEVLRFEGDEVDMELHVSKGTYIRTIVDDLGELLGCGAHVSMLRRVSVGSYPREKMITIEALEALLQKAKDEDVVPSTYLDEILVPMETALEGMPSVEVDASSIMYLRNGNPVQVSGAPISGMVQVYSDSGEFLGVGQINDDGLVAPKRIVVEHQENF